jgi:hypothetical protein
LSNLNNFIPLEHKPMIKASPESNSRLPSPSHRSTIVHFCSLTR